MKFVEISPDIFELKFAFFRLVKDLSAQTPFYYFSLDFYGTLLCVCAVCF